LQIGFVLLRLEQADIRPDQVQPRIQAGSDPHAIEPGHFGKTMQRLPLLVQFGAGIFDQRQRIGRLANRAEHLLIVIRDGLVEPRGRPFMPGAQLAAFEDGEMDGGARPVGHRAGREEIAGGTALDGSAGQPMFSGSGASDIAVTLASASGIATAPAGAPAGSRDAANLTALRTALSTNDIAGDTNNLLFDISSKVFGRTTTRDALVTIAASAKIALSSQAGVDLDQEAVNLVRYQQAFQASGRAMQVATELFDTILGIG